MKELLQYFKLGSKKDVYIHLIDMYMSGCTHLAKDSFNKLDDIHKKEFINSMSPYDPAYTFFSTLEFTETV